MRETRDELQRFKACFDANGLPKHLDELEWRFLANPAGPLLVDFAIDAEGPDETVAAIYATMPVRAKLEREPCLAVQSLDTLTDSDYRGRGLFRKLADAAYEQLRARGVAFVYGFPNENSAHAFFERLGWSSLDPMPYLFRPLRLGYLLEKTRLPRRVWAPVARLPIPIPVWRRRLAADLEIRTVEQFDESFDRLWEDFASQIDVAVCRDREYLTWRLSERPGETYRTLGLYRESRLEGFVSFCHKRAESHHIG